jgi:hypothetical protein
VGRIRLWRAPNSKLQIAPVPSERYVSTLPYSITPRARIRGRGQHSNELDEVLPDVACGLEAGTPVGQRSREIDFIARQAG